MELSSVPRRVGRVAGGLFVDSLDGGVGHGNAGDRGGGDEWTNWQSEAVHRVNIDRLGGVSVCSDV